jgi:hypothetical protein
MTLPFLQCAGVWGMTTDASHPAVSLDFEGDASALRGAASATLAALINTQAAQLAELLAGADHFRKVMLHVIFLDCSITMHEIMLPPPPPWHAQGVQRRTVTAGPTAVQRQLRGLNATACVGALLKELKERS